MFKYFFPLVGGWRRSHAGVFVCTYACVDVVAGVGHSLLFTYFSSKYLHLCLFLFLVSLNCSFYFETFYFVCFEAEQ